MDSRKINELLTKYWACETSLEEEQQLREYFRGGEIPEQWKETAELFRYFEQTKKKSLSDVSFDDDVLSKMKAPQRSNVMRMLYNTMRIAAGVAVLVMAVWFVRRDVHDPAQQAQVDTYSDPKLAFEETKKALMMISKSFGQAEEQAKKINLFNEAQEKIQQDKKENDKQKPNS